MPIPELLALESNWYAADGPAEINLQVISGTDLQPLELK
jgi:hypothetical protein